VHAVCNPVPDEAHLGRNRGHTVIKLILSNSIYGDMLRCWRL